jgi:hypothetical protein
MVDASTRRGTAPHWPLRLAGGLLVLLGTVNAGLAVLSLATQLVRLPPAAEGGLLVAGLVTAGTGVLVWGGSALALALALTVFGALLVVQVGDLAAGGGEGAGPRTAVLGVVVATLTAAWLGRRSARRRS